MPTSTPWGPSQHSEILAPGIVLHITAGHSGIHLSESRLAALPRWLAEYEPFAGRGWYEGDDDAGFVVMAFASSFAPRTVWNAIDQARLKALNGNPVAQAFLASEEFAKARSVLGALFDRHSEWYVRDDHASSLERVTARRVCDGCEIVESACAPWVRLVKLPDFPGFEFVSVDEALRARLAAAVADAAN